MRQIRAIIADDEEALRSHLRMKLATHWPELAIIGEARDGEAALRLINNKHPEIAFLDIRMPGLSGLEVARRIAGTCWVVFVTAYDQYAIEAFEREAVDYLLKPISDERLAKTIQRIKERLTTSVPDISAVVEKIAGSLRKSEGYLQWIKAQHHDSIRLIPVADVCYFRATDKYTTVRTREGEFLIRTTLRELEEQLDPSRFWRVHRAAIVNAKAIDTVTRSIAGTFTIAFRNIPDHITVSRPYAHLFKQM